MPIKIPLVRTIPIMTLSLLLPACSSSITSPEEVTKTPQLGSTSVLPSEHWQLAWEDDFEGASINRRYWSFEENCWGGGNNEQQCYTASESNAFVKDGLLHIVAKKESATGWDNPEGAKEGAKKTLPYTSARLRTKGKRDQKYGRFEVRAKLPSGQGVWPAIWMLPSEDKYGTWAASGEIDIVEAVNLGTQSDAPTAKQGDRENRIHGTLHYGRAWPDNVHTGIGVTLPGGVNPADEFHTYAIEWEEGEIRWYVDNIHYATQTHQGWYSQYEHEGELIDADSLAPFNEKFHLLLNVAVGGSWAANTNEKGIDSEIFPKTMLVDYVKVYRCAKDRWKGKGCSSVSDEAVMLKGQTAPKILVADDSYANGAEIELFGDTLHPSLAYGSYDPTDVVDFKEVDYEKRGKVLEVTKREGGGNVYFRSPKTDLTDWLESGVLSFDIKVTSQSDGAELVIKLDSGWPATSDITVPIESHSDWQTIFVDIKDIVASGNRYETGYADPSNINNLLVIEPVGEMSLLLDNIRMKRD